MPQFHPPASVPRLPADARLHDSANWLAVALGHASLLERELLSEALDREAIRDRVGLIRAALEASRRIHDDLRGVARSVEETGEGPDGPCELGAMLSEAARHFESLVRRPGSPRARLVTALPTEGRLWVRAGRAELADALTNLVANALDACADEDRVELAAGQAGAEGWLRVRDTGCGMDSELLERCQEAGVSTKGPKGSGLGLANVQQMVAARGGSMRILSERRVGTTVELRFPLVADFPDPSHHRAGRVWAKAAARARSAAEPDDVLIVDDEPAVAEVLVELCSLMGYRSEAVGAGERALMHLNQRSSRVVLLDQGLPDMPGERVADAIRQAHPSTTIVLLSGSLGPGGPDASPAVDLRATKPLGYEELQRLLQKALHMHDHRASTTSPREGTPAVKLSSSGSPADPGAPA